MKDLFRFGSLLVFLLMLPGSAHAERESWYTYWGFGWSHIEYPGDSDNNLRDLPGVDSISVSVDMLGLYFPVNEHSNLLVGFIINGAGERFSFDGEWVQLNLYQIGFSMLSFYGKEPGDGFFLRSDLGRAWGSTDSSFGSSSESESGWGGTFGIGFGFPTSEETRILLNLNHGYRSIEDESFNVTNVSVGGLF
jgi:hypothetical protein